MGCWLKVAAQFAFWLCISSSMHLHGCHQQVGKQQSAVLFGECQPSGLAHDVACCRTTPIVVVISSLHVESCAQGVDALPCKVAWSVWWLLLSVRHSFCCRSCRQGHKSVADLAQCPDGSLQHTVLYDSAVNLFFVNICRNGCQYLHLGLSVSAPRQFRSMYVVSGVVQDRSTMTHMMLCTCCLWSSM